MASLVISGIDRAKYGCIVQFEIGLCKHFTGESITDALEQAADFADQYETKISVISTPASIYRDMQGNRYNHRDDRSILHSVEANLLAIIKRRDLLSK